VRKKWQPPRGGFDASKPIMPGEMTNCRRRGERGLTLIEASMVLALSAVVVAGVMLYYQSASDNNKLQSAESLLGGIQTAVQAVYAGRHEYTGLTTSTIANSNGIPSNLRDNAGNVHTPWQGNVAVAMSTLGGKNDRYYIEFFSVPLGACAQLAAQPLGASLYQVWVGPTQLGPNYSQPSASAAIAACNAQASNGVDDILWYFR
jgi:type II secretory pathway pseudopilin PulG